MDVYKIKASAFIPCILSLNILFFLRDFANIAVPSIVFLAIAVLIALFSDKTEVIAFCFCCIPVLNAFQSKYALWLCMIIYIVRFVKKPTIYAHFLPVFFLVLWEVLHKSADFSFVEVIRLFTELSFCCFIGSLTGEDFDFDKTVRTMSFTAVCACITILLSQLKGYGYSVTLLFSGVFRLGYGIDETRMSVGFNPNYLAYICICCISGLVYIVYKKRQNLFDTLFIAMLSVFGLLTMSKKFVLCLLIMFVLFFLCWEGFEIKGKIKSLLLTIAIIIPVVFIMQRVFPTAYDALILRFGESDMSTGRNDIFAYYTEMLLSDPNLLMFGVGLQGYETKLLTNYNLSIPHNAFQELLVMWGIPGFIAFVAFLILLMNRAHKLNHNIQFVNYIPLIIMLVNIQVSQMASSSVVTILIAFVYMCLVTDMKTSADRANTMPQNQE